MFDAIIDEAVARSASDIHISKNIYPVLRVNGKLILLTQHSIVSDAILERCVEALLSGCTSLRKKYEINRQLDISFVRDRVRFRVHIYFEKGSMAIAMRLIPTVIPSLLELNLPQVIETFTTLRNGLVLVTGITGSGKSTTLAAVIDSINTHQNKHIITVENPIEFIHEHKKSVVHQREVGHDVPDFVSAVKAAVREDPDVFLVGEMRDLETIQQAITLAETGHLVLGTLHTRSAAETVDRIIDVFPPNQQQQIRLQVSSVLQGVVSQQLLKMDKKEKRVPVCEVMIVNDAIRSLIRESAPPNSIVDQLQMNHKKDGSQTLAQALAHLYNSKLISYETGLQATDDVEMFKRMIVASSKQGGKNVLFAANR